MTRYACCFTLKSRSRFAPLALSVTLAAGLLVAAQPAARAQGADVVIDPTSIANALQNYADQATRWVEQEKQFVLENNRWIQTAAHYESVLKHYADQVQYWNQQLTKLRQLNFTALTTLQNQFNSVAADYGVDDACPGVKQSIAGEITSALTYAFNLDGDLTTQQQQVCTMIQMTKNKKYNDTVDYLKKLGNNTNDLIGILQQRLTLSPDPGDLQSNIDENASFQARIAQAKADWEANMAQDDAQIAMLSQTQANLSRRAMAGSPSNIIGDFVNAGILKAALQ